MTARTHDLAAATALAVVALGLPARHVSVPAAILIVLANQLGGIAPDIDQPTAPLWRNLPIGRLFGKVIDKMLGGHRFISHSLLGLALFGFLFHWLLVFFSSLMPSVDIGYVWWAFMIGALSHLAMDTFTKEGVPWLLPLPFKFGIPPLKKLRVTTGKWAEKFIFLLLVLFNLLLLSSNYIKLVDVVRHIY